MRWTEARILDAVAAHFDAHMPSRMLRQVEVGGRRLDGLIVTLDGTRHAIEAKTSREDFRREHNAKRAPAERFAHSCWYAAPPGIIGAADLPPGWGLVIVGGDQPEVAAQPRLRTPEGVGQGTLTGLLQRLATVENRLARSGDPAARAAALECDVERLQGILATRDAALERERARARAAAEAVLACAGEQSCSACGHPVRFRPTGLWGHVSRAQDRPCATERAEVERLRREAATGAAYGSVPAPPVTPKLVEPDA